MQRYEFNDGKSSKFWQIEQVGAELHISWGKIGTSGQSQVKDFDTDEKATAAKDKLVKEKTGKGYVAAGEAPMAAGSTLKVATPKAEPRKVEAKEDTSQPQTAPRAESEARPVTAKAAASVAATHEAPVPSPASLQAPREAIDAWLAARRSTPSVDERALQAWPLALQAIVDAAQGKSRASLTPKQLQRASGLDEPGLAALDGWLKETGMGYGQGLDELNYLTKDKAAQAERALAAAQATDQTQAQHLQAVREAIWAPLHASEPEARWPGRFGQQLLTQTSKRQWPMRGKGPSTRPSDKSAKEAWYLLRKGNFQFVTVAQSDPALQAPLQHLLDRLASDLKAQPDQGSDQMLLNLCVCVEHEATVRSNQKLVVAYLVQAHGLATFVRMLAEASQLEGNYQYSLNRKWSLNARSAARELPTFERPNQDLLQQLHQWLLAADSTEWRAAEAAAIEVIPTLREHERGWMGLTFADSPQVAKAVLDSYSGRSLPQSALWLLMALPMGDDFRRVATIKPDFDRYGTDNLFEEANLLNTVLLKMGDEALSLLVNGVAHAPVADALAQINDTEAVLALARQAPAGKDRQARLKLALARWPLAGAVALARLCAQGGKDTPLLLPMLRQLMHELGPALALVAADVPPAARQLLADLLARQSQVRDEASPDALPPVLQNPPWLQAKKRVAVKVMDLAPLAVADAMANERPKLDAWPQGRLDEMLAAPVPNAKALAKELRVHEAYGWRQKGGPLAYLDALAKAIAAKDSQALIAAWEAGFEEERAIDPSRFWPRLSGFECLRLPEQLALPLWNAKAGTVSAGWSNEHQIVMAHWGLAALPGWLRLMRGNPGTMLTEALTYGSTEIAITAARAAFKLKKLRKPGLAWLKRWPEHGMAGLIAPALGKAGEARDVAAKALRWYASHGLQAQLMAMAARYDDPKVTAAVQAVLGESPLDLHPSKVGALPDLWTPLSWARPELLSGQALGDDAMTALGQMLMFPRTDGVYEGLNQVVAVCSRESLAEFGWEMFSAWLAAGAPSKDNWMFSALGLLGNDDVARRLTPLIRAWPGEGGHARAVAGLDVLEGIGTDTALMLLNGIAQKVKFKGLQDKAREKIAAIAEARGLTTEELEDRLAPDLGLDEQGTLVLDFGPRQFKVGFDEALKPWVRDYTDGKDGARLKDLPKPIKSDDAEKAKEATERYKLLKKDAKTIAAQQIARLEIAMCQQRRWTAENFRDFMADHPLVRHIAQRLIWGVYTVDARTDEADEAGEGSEAVEVSYPNFGGELLACFRLAEDGSLSTADDEAYALPTEVEEGKALRIGIPHALHLPPEDAQAFGQLFADYELLQPFAQVGRDTYTLTDAERAGKELTRWKDKKVPTGRILGLANKAWRKGDAQDGGGVWYFTKPLGDGHEIELSFDPGFTVGMVDDEPEQTLGALTYGTQGRWGGDVSSQQDWAGLDAISASELIRDMETLVAP